jgi:hypothetical protein
MVPASSLPFLALSTTYSVAARVLAHHPPTAGATIPVVQVHLYLIYLHLTLVLQQLSYTGSSVQCSVQYTVHQRCSCAHLLALKVAILHL